MRGGALDANVVEVLMVVLAPRVVVMLIEPAYGTVVVNGVVMPLIVKVSTSTAYAVVSWFASLFPVRDETTTVENPVESRVSRA